MDYDEQHRICEKEFELDDAYTVAMDAMPEHWKEEADAQLTYLRNMHTCYSHKYLEAYSGSTFPFLQVFSRPEIRSTGILEPGPNF